VNENADHVYFIGALPPPVHGLSNINARMLETLRAAGVNVHPFDVARPPGNESNGGRRLSSLLESCRGLSQFCRKLVATRGRKRSYIALSGGFGQARDACFIGLSRLFGAKVYIHHHSFAYLNRSSQPDRRHVLPGRRCVGQPYRALRGHDVASGAVLRDPLGQYRLPVESRVFRRACFGRRDAEGAPRRRTSADRRIPVERHSRKRHR
jgi:hypothetical protein